MVRRLLLVIALSAMSMGLPAACATRAQSADPHGADAPATPAPSAATVTLSDVTVTPRSVDIAAGGTVTWRNDDLTAHRLVSLAPNVVQSPRLEIGASYALTFSSPGTYPYYCTIHDTMKGTVIVHRAP